jgi:hypothetical protein
MNYNRGARSCRNRRAGDVSDPSNARILRGECFCRKVAYEVADRFEYALNCHCSNCRRATGSAFKPFAGIPRGRLRLVRGGHDLLIYGEMSENGPHDVYCAHCGSLLWSVVRPGTYAHLATGTLVDPPSIRPTAHIFAGSLASCTKSPTICRNMWGRSHSRNFEGKHGGNPRTGAGSGVLIQEGLPCLQG